ncbi:MAG: exodeoxyribonuclease VII large subunit, partial [Solirubrobacteraceae bacterium]
SGRRRVDNERKRVGRRALVIDRRVQAEALDARRASGLQALAMALAAHDPDRTLERGYALVADRDGEVVTSAAAARRAGDVSVRFSDAAVDATISGDDDDRA